MGGIRLYTLLIIAVLVSGLVALLPFAWSGGEALTLSWRESAVRDMEASAKLLALSLPEIAPGTGRAEIAPLIESARAASNTRYTLVLRDGSVLADSDEDAARMENHANRPEIKTALAGATGVEIRRSPTMDGDWIYVATPLPGGGVLRAGSSMAELNDRLSLWWRKGMQGAAVSIIVLVVTAVVAARSLSKPLEAAAAGAERYAAGDFGFRIPVSGSREMRRLSGAMGTMAKELDSRFRLIVRQREEMRAVFENMSEGVLAVDGSGAVMLSNSAAEKMLGIDTTVSGRYVAAGIRNADLLDALREAGASGLPQERELRIRNDAAREDTILLAHAARVAEYGESGNSGIAVLAVLRDVTRLRRLEVMRRDFVANVSHELRTPITAVQSCLETLQDDESVAGENAGFLEMALRNTRRMGAIISNLLFLAGMESNAKTEAAPPAVSPVRPVLDEAVQLCASEAGARNVSVHVDCEDGLTALMNPQLVSHALVNLLDNAIKYGPENSAITLAAKTAGDEAEITVSDRGPGIAPRHQARVFERFYRVDGLSRMRKGSGLGLAIVKHIALSQGGDIRVESEIGAGSTFRLTLPRA